MLVEVGHREIAVTRQCELLGLPRSSFYYEPRGESAGNLRLMRLIDEKYTRHPFFGVQKITSHLRRKGCCVNHKRIARLMRLMGLQAVCPRPRMSRSDGRERKYPYLLRGLVIERPDHVWSTDITYIRMRGGFLYLTVIMDCFSRYVVTWRLSNSLDAWFCVEALEEALGKSRPDILNSDQGAQFSCEAFTGRAKEAGISISMTGSGRVCDNILIERLWRTVKYEEVYLKEYGSARDVRQGLAIYFDFYNNERPHEALGYRTPAEMYCRRFRNEESKRSGRNAKDGMA